jgi:hypothetical protein
MNVKELIERLQEFPPEFKVLVSCEGGCVEDDDISVRGHHVKKDYVVIEI